ncbi:MAG: TonB-dependent receptor [Candidatus Eisenbacteria bacterium]|uniref:TonB-dependent receptor n=1 Tax=Eiseniibacteriota bacterium TaxID=2212470 RepID=A0A9D6QP82_UNCEI|nr:TonB-dependent receptor [Candidatus Eisenbacteria bacterium]MBI3539679.1 TonB-dependent receptor [Candidatus Eisenbacteria bacterium]
MSRRAPWAVAAVVFVVAITLFAPVARAGTTGKLTGTVKDEQGKPVVGANVRVEGLRIGALSDDQGTYLMIGIPGGEYVIHANMMGYAAFTASHVTIQPDFTTEINITLKTEAVQMNEVKVDAERPLLQKDATSTTRFLSSDQLARLPTRGYQDAAAQQSGVVNFQRLIDQESQNGPTLIVRGGRPNETAYYVDGFSQQDPLTGNSTTSINNDAIQEVVVLNGGFNAEYGRIMSGVINVITREGSHKYSGSFESLTDNFSGYGKNILGAKSYDYNVYDFNFGGPLVPNKDWGTFYYSGERRWDRDRRPNSLFDGPIPSNGLAGWTHQAKLSVPLGDKMALRLGGLVSSDDWQEYLNTYRFNLAHAPRYQDRNRSVTGQFNHTLSTKSFYSLGVNYFYTDRKRGDGVYFDDVASYSAHGQANIRPDIPWFWPGYSGLGTGPLGDSLAAEAARAGTGHVFDDYLHRESQYIGVKGDYTNQVNPFHQMKAGLEVDRHNLRFYENYFPSTPGLVQDINRYGFAIDGKTHVDGGLDGPRKPLTASAYIQDKYERAGLVVNAGLRYDYINVDVPALLNENVPLGTLGTLDSSRLVDNKRYSRVSPRVGIGFPVTDKTVMHVNWGQFFQQPNLQDLYVSYQFLEHKIKTGGYYVGFGNPNLKPEQTTAYEVGIQHMVSPRARLDITAYYKDVKDLVEVATISSFPNAFSSYRNKDYGTVKGVDVGFALRRVNHIEANFAYSLSYAVGTGSVSNTQRNIAWYADNPPKQTAPLDFDQRHKLSVNLDYLLNKGEGPKVGGKAWFENMNIDVLFNVASGTPYTPTNIYDEVTLAAVATQPIGPINSRYGPWTQTVDFKATRSFPVGNVNVSVYGWVLNAFDTKNAINEFTGTGSPYSTAYLNTSDGNNLLGTLAAESIDGRDAYAKALQSPALFSNPRLIRFGLRVGF